MTFLRQKIFISIFSTVSFWILYVFPTGFTITSLFSRLSLVIFCKDKWNSYCNKESKSKPSFLQISLNTPDKLLWLGIYFILFVFV